MKSQKELLNEGYSLLAMKKYNQAETILLAALKAKNDNLIDRHFIYNCLIDLYYKRREEKPEYIDNCIYYCKEDIATLPQFIKEYKKEECAEFDIKESEVDLPCCPSITRLAIIYENNSQFQEAIDLCNYAINLGLSESTKGGFTKRIEKLINKMNKKPK